MNSFIVCSFKGQSYIEQESIIPALNMSNIFKHMFKQFEITNQSLCLMGEMLNDLTNMAINVKNRFVTKI
jgi:hypothetical protein